MRVRLTVEGTRIVLHEGPRSWSSAGGEPPPAPTAYDRLPPYGLVVNFAGFPLTWVSLTDWRAEIPDPDFEMVVFSVGIRFPRKLV